MELYIFKLVEFDGFKIRYRFIVDFVETQKRIIWIAGIPKIQMDIWPHFDRNK